MPLATVQLTSELRVRCEIDVHPEQTATLEREPIPYHAHVMQWQIVTGTNAKLMRWFHDEREAGEDIFATLLRFCDDPERNVYH